MASISEILADYYAKLTVDKIPQEVFDRTKEIVLDYLGCAIGGASLDSSKMAKKVFAPQEAAEGSTIYCDGKAPVEKAAFINGVYSHGLEMDDLNAGAGGHPAVAILPAAIAMAEREKASGLDLMMAVMVGYDMMYRVGQAADPESQFKRGFHPTSINGAFGAAMAAAWLLKLNPEQTVNAIGIVGGFTSGNLECYTDGALTKRLNPGVAAQGGVLAALLAKEGYTGPHFIFEGRNGFLNGYSGNPDQSKLTVDLNYVMSGILTTAFKPYANCRNNHGCINAALDLRKEHNIDYREIEEVEGRVNSMGYRAVCEPADIKYNPTKMVDAQFSLPYSLAISLVKGKAFIEEYEPETFYNPDVRAMMKKVKLVCSEELEKLLPDPFPSEVVIRMKDGTVYQKRIIDVKGDPKNPMTMDELESKFTALAKLSMSDETKIAQIIDVVKKLDKVSIFDLTSLLGR